VLYIGMFLLDETLGMDLSDAMKAFVENTVVAGALAEMCDHAHDQLIDSVQHFLAVLSIGMFPENVAVRARLVLAKVKIISLFEKGSRLPMFDQCVVLFQGSASSKCSDRLDMNNRIQEKARSDGLVRASDLFIISSPNFFELFCLTMIQTSFNFSRSSIVNMPWESLSSCPIGLREIIDGVQPMFVLELAVDQLANASVRTNERVGGVTWLCVFERASIETNDDTTLCLSLSLRRVASIRHCFTYSSVHDTHQSSCVLLLSLSLSLSLSPISFSFALEWGSYTSCQREGKGK
jgi:hypothetical protein